MRAAVLALVCLWPMAGQAFWPFGNDGIAYAIAFEGETDEMQAWLSELGLDAPVTTNPPQDLDELAVEASSLADKVKKALLAKGYMEAFAESSLNREAEPPLVTIRIEQGVRYPVRAVRLDWHDEELGPVDMQTLETKAGQPVDMQAIEQDADTLHKAIGTDACLLSLSVTPKLLLYPRAQAAEVVFAIAHGPVADFGEAVITGNEKVEDSVVNRAVAWKPGECFTQAKINATRTRLIESQLFASVDVAPAATPVEGQVPVVITVRERVARTVSAGMEYSTDEGFGTYAGWEHRNLFGEAEKLTTSLKLAELSQRLEGILRKPAFLRDDQILVLSSSIENESTDAYDALTFDVGAAVERRLSRHLNSGLGVAYTLSSTDDVLTGKNDYALLSFPGFLEYDNRDDALDATKGVLGRISATPYTETIGDGGQFLKVLATGQSYLTAHDMAMKPTLATRLSVGSIIGGEGDDVPSQIRYYAGGGGSVRGYSYQSLAPYFRGEPIGGSSLLEGSAELRLRFTEQFGGVAFLDAGNAFAGETPEFGSDLYYGAGVGVRYFSPVGPLRADIGFPLNGKDVGEEGYQFYVSLGQAF